LSLFVAFFLSRFSLFEYDKTFYTWWFFLTLFEISTQEKNRRFILLSEPRREKRSVVSVATTTRQSAVKQKENPDLNSFLSFLFCFRPQVGVNRLSFPLFFLTHIFITQSTKNLVFWDSLLCTTQKTNQDYHENATAVCSGPVRLVCLAWFKLHLPIEQEFNQNTKRDTTNPQLAKIWKKKKDSVSRSFSFVQIFHGVIFLVQKFDKKESCVFAFLFTSFVRPVKRLHGKKKPLPLFFVEKFFPLSEKTIFSVFYIPLVCSVELFRHFSVWRFLFS
jgi:hypothetical protein